MQREALHALFVDLMHGLCADMPLIWVVDDLHFASTDSMQLLLSLARAAATGSLANILSITGKYEEAEAEFKRTRELMRRIGNRRGEASSLLNLGTVYTRAGQADRARPIYEQALELVREIGYRRGVAIASGNLGIMETHEGFFDAAMRRFRKCLAISREVGDAEGEGNALLNLGSVFATLGQFEEAEGLVQESRALCERAGLRMMAGHAMGRLGGIALGRRDFRAARDWSTEALLLWEELPYPSGVLSTRASLGYILARLGRSPEAVLHLDEVLAAQPDPAAGLVHLVAACHRAALPGGDPAAAEGALDEAGDPLELEMRMFLRFELYEVTGTARHLEEAYASLMHLVRNAPESSRASMLARVPLHHDIKTAWESNSGAGGSAPTVVV